MSHNNNNNNNNIQEGPEAMISDSLHPPALVIIPDINADPLSPVPSGGVGGDPGSITEGSLQQELIDSPLSSPPNSVQWDMRHGDQDDDDDEDEDEDKVLQQQHQNSYSSAADLNMPSLSQHHREISFEEALLQSPEGAAGALSLLREERKQRKLQRILQQGGNANANSSHNNNNNNTSSTSFDLNVSTSNISNNSNNNPLLQLESFASNKTSSSHSNQQLPLQQNTEKEEEPFDQPFDQPLDRHDNQEQQQTMEDQPFDHQEQKQQQQHKQSHQSRDIDEPWDSAAAANGNSSSQGTSNTNHNHQHHHDPEEEPALIQPRMTVNTLTTTTLLNDVSMMTEQSNLTNTTTQQFDPDEEDEPMAIPSSIKKKNNNVNVDDNYASNSNNSVCDHLANPGKSSAARILSFEDEHDQAIIDNRNNNANDNPSNRNVTANATPIMPTKQASVLSFEDEHEHEPTTHPQQQQIAMPMDEQEEEEQPPALSVARQPSSRSTDSTNDIENQQESQLPLSSSVEPDNTASSKTAVQRRLQRYVDNGGATAIPHTSPQHRPVSDIAATLTSISTTASRGMRPLSRSSQHLHPNANGDASDQLPFEDEQEVVDLTGHGPDDENPQMARVDHRHGQRAYNRAATLSGSHQNNRTNSTPTVRDVLSFDPYAASAGRVSSRSESQILLQPRAASKSDRSVVAESTAQLSRKTTKEQPSAASAQPPPPPPTATSLENVGIGSPWRQQRTKPIRSNYSSALQEKPAADQVEGNSSRPIVVGYEEKKCSDDEFIRRHVQEQLDECHPKDELPVEKPLHYGEKDNELTEQKAPLKHSDSFSSRASRSKSALDRSDHDKMDDDASWLANRVGSQSESQKSQPKKQKQRIDENASWLAERLDSARSGGASDGSLNSSTMDETASWLRGQVQQQNQANNSSVPTSILASQPPSAEKSSRRTRDAPGTRANSTPKTSIYPQDGTSSRSIHIQRSKEKTREPLQKRQQEVPGKSPERPSAKVVKISKVPAKKRDSPELTGTAVPTSVVAKGPNQADSSSDAPVEDVGLLLESLDEMVKDLEVSMSPDHEPGRNKTQSVRHVAEDVAAAQKYAKTMDDSHSGTQATSVLSASHTSDNKGNSSAIAAVNKGGVVVAPTDSTPKKSVKPVFVQPINNDIGIPKGDVMISLLSENDQLEWTARIEEAIWRCRTMRQNCDTKWIQQKLLRSPDGPSNGRTPVLADVDDGRVVGGIESVAVSQRAAMEHLKYDDLDDALALYEDIIESYYSHFEECLRANTAADEIEDQVVMFQSYIAGCLHNIGVIYLLMNKPREAYDHFERAASKRQKTLGVGHTDHVASHVKQAICHIALGRHTDALVILEECLTLSKDGARSISDQRQVAEIYNNLGCLYYTMGNMEKAGSYFLESFEAQNIALENSLYAGARFSCHSATLNLAITKANMGFLALVARHSEVAVDALEYAVHNQQLLLRDAHPTLIASMDHLAVAQILAGQRDKAIRILRRMYHMQSEAFGPSDSRPLETLKKVSMLEESESPTSSPSTSNAPTKKNGKQPNSVFKLFKSMAQK